VPEPDISRRFLIQYLKVLNQVPKNRIQSPRLRPIRLPIRALFSSNITGLGPFFEFRSKPQIRVARWRLAPVVFSTAAFLLSVLRASLYLTNILALTLGFIVLLVLQYGTLWLSGKLFNPLPDPGFVRFPPLSPSSSCRYWGSRP
jgi:hypothetical protein